MTSCRNNWGELVRAALTLSGTLPPIKRRYDTGVGSYSAVTLRESEDTGRAAACTLSEILPPGGGLSLQGRR